MGVEFYEEEGYFRAYTRGLKGAVIRLPVASVGATENIVLAAVKARGVTVLQNAAKEPEIISLCEFLTKAGAIIEGTGTDTLLIKGLEELHGITYRIPSDRIVAGTYLFSVLGTGGHIFLRDAPVQHMYAVLKKQWKWEPDLLFPKTEYRSWQNRYRMRFLIRRRRSIRGSRPICSPR